MLARFLLVCAVAFFAAAWNGPINAQSLIAAPVDEAVADALRENLTIATRRLADNDVAAADRAFDKVIDSPAFATLDADVRYAALLRAGIAALELGAHAKAHGLVVRACQFDEVEGIAWHLRVQASFALDDYVDSGLGLTVIALRWPETLDQVRNRAIFDVLRQLEKTGQHRDERFALLSALFAANWTIDGMEPNELWFDYVRYLLEKSDFAHATEVVARIDSPEIVLALRVDKRFDSLGRARSGSFDVPRAMQRQRARLQQLRKEHPDKLSYVVDDMVIDLDDGNAERALATADSVIARVSTAQTPAYSDVEDRYNWVLDTRSRALQRLGRWDEAVAQQRRAARRPESGRMNVSQSLNLARLLARLDRGSEAEEAMEEIGSMSSYGRVQLGMNRLIAAHSRGDKKGVNLQLGVMYADRRDAMTTYQAALVIAGRMDEAVELLVERLRSEDWRKGALADMQTYTEIAHTPLDKDHMTRWREILAREDVRETLDKVGRIEQVPFANPLF